MIFKNFKLFLTVNIIYVIACIFLSDQFFQYELIAKHPTISYISLISPLSYSIALVSNAIDIPDFLTLANLFAIKNGMDVEEFIASNKFVPFYEKYIVNIYGLNIFNIHDSFYVSDNYILKIVFNRWQKILNLTVPIIIDISAWPLIYSFYYKNFKLNSLE